MNPLFEKLLQAQARAEDGNAFRQEFEYGVTTIQGINREPRGDEGAMRTKRPVSVLSPLH